MERETLTVPKRRPGRPKGSKNKPKVVKPPPKPKQVYIVNEEDMDPFWRRR